MALFGDDEGDVPPFDMTEDGEDWFQFTLDNLEMDRGCSPLQQDANPMEQEAIDFGDTDQDDDVDEPSHAGGSGPGPPDTRDGSDGSPRRRPRASCSNVTDVREIVVGKAKQDQQQDQDQQQEKGTTSRGLPVPPAKSRQEKVKLEAKEVQDSPVQKKLASEGAAAKRSSRASRSEAKSRHRAAGGMAGGVGGMPGRGEAASTSSNKERAEGRTGGKAMSTSTSGNGGGGTAAARANSVQNRRRLERNAREQKRSLKISQRIEDLRRMLTQFGVDVKASKSAVLSEATDYIAHLQRQQAQFEAERARLLTLLQNSTRGAAGGTTSTISLDGGGDELTDSAMSTSNSPSRARVKPPPAPSSAQEHPLPFSSIAGPGHSTTATSSGGGNGGSENRNGSGFGKCEAQSTQKPWVIGEASETTAMTQLPSAGQPRSSMTGICVPGQGSGTGLMPAGGSLAGMIPTGAVPLGTPLVAAAATAGGGNAGILEATARALSHVNYERVFRTAPVPMAIANVNGNLVDCNTRLTQVTGFRRDEVLFLTIFDLVADPFLQHTFSMISSILSLRGVANPPFFQVLGKRRDGGPAGVVQISVVQDDALRPLHFCISVIEGAACPGATPVGGGGGGTIPSAVGSTTSGVDTSIAVGGGGFVTARNIVGEGRNSGGGRIGAGSSVASAGARGRDGSGGGEGGGGVL